MPLIRTRINRIEFGELKIVGTFLNQSGGLNNETTALQKRAWEPAMVGVTALADSSVECCEPRLVARVVTIVAAFLREL
jgi:hypothetical protein